VIAGVELLREQVAAACRVLAIEGYADLTLGHVSARVPGQDAILIKRKGPALDEVEPDDVVEVGLDGAARNGGAVDIHLEVVLHTEVYRARPDVGAVVHGHPPYATALAATDTELELLTHDAVLFADGLGRYEDSADLIVSPEQGAAVAAALGPHRAALLRNHGVIAVGKDVPWAALTAATLERAARLQSLAATFGRLRPISRESAARLAPVKYRDAFVEEYWRAWLRRTLRNGA
jgi:L-fuculose-phosphate aldolase